MGWELHVYSIGEGIVNQRGCFWKRKYLKPESLKCVVVFFLFS